MILLAVVLVGALTIAIQGTTRPEGASISPEQLVIDVTAVQRYASELERAVLYIVTQNGQSQDDIRFAHFDAHADYGNLAADADPVEQVFHQDGGGATYRAPPAGINDGSAWEFYGTTHAPQVGSSRSDLIAVLPNVTQDFCNHLNTINGQTGAQPADPGAVAASTTNAGSCVHGGAVARFGNGVGFYATAGTMNEATFTKLPAKQGCVACDGPAYHFYHVIYAR